MEKSQNNQKKGDKCLKAAMERMKVLRSKTFAFLFFFFYNYDGNDGNGCLLEKTR